MTDPSYRIQGPPDASPVVSTWLWIMQDSRERLLGQIQGLSVAELDFRPETTTHTVGTLLYHLAATDLGWLFEDILQTERSDEARRLLPHPYWNPDGHLWPLRGESLEQHLERLQRSREILVASVRDLSEEELLRPILTRPYETNVEWILYHLAEHETYHRGQISEILKARR